MWELLALIWAVVKWVPCLAFVLLAGMAVLSHLLWALGRLPRLLEPLDRCPPFHGWMFLFLAFMVAPARPPDWAILAFFVVLGIDMIFLSRPGGGVIRFIHPPSKEDLRDAGT
jgi:hypothetical protein